ncbi:MAG: glycosyltransferase family 4 protein, partial [Hyphomicrobiales bacterium]
MKPPTHPIVSGDRQVARLLMRALAQSAHDVVLVSEFRSYMRAPGGEEEKNLRDLANAERDRITNAINDGAMRRPEIWFSYHPYYKSPDWLGPILSEELGIPYVTAESSYAGKRDKGEWAHAQAEVR